MGDRDPVTAALASSLALAAQAGAWETVKRLAELLDAQRDRGKAEVVSIDDVKRRKR